MDELKQFTELELNIKALEKLGIKVKHNSNPMEKEIGGKSYFQLKDIDSKKNQVVFYFSSFGNKDSDGDILMKGAFTKTIKENFSRIKHLYNHSKIQSPGVIKELHEDEHGAYAVSQLIPTTLGKDILIEYEHGVITEHSMGFQTIKDREDKAKGAVEIMEVKLWEVSSLTAWGANHLTPVIGVKEDEQIEALMKSIEDILHNSNISDIRGKELETQMEVLKSKLTKTKPVEKAPVNYTDLLKGLQF